MTAKYEVHVEYDGVCEPNIFKPLFASDSKEECIDFIRRHWKTYHRGKQTLALIGPDGRSRSFVL